MEFSSKSSVQLIPFFPIGIGCGGLVQIRVTLLLKGLGLPLLLCKDFKDFGLYKRVTLAS